MSFFCVRWKQDGDVASSRLCVPPPKQSRMFLYRYGCFYPTFTLWSPGVWHRVVWLVDMKVTEKHRLKSRLRDRHFSSEVEGTLCLPQPCFPPYQTIRFHNRENLMSCTPYTQNWRLNFALVSCTWNKERNRLSTLLLKLPASNEFLQVIK